MWKYIYFLIIEETFCNNNHTFYGTHSYLSEQPNRKILTRTSLNFTEQQLNCTTSTSLNNWQLERNQTFKKMSKWDISLIINGLIKIAAV